MNKKDFTKEDDYVIGQECVDCFSYWDSDTEEDSCDCGKELVTHTSHEGCECKECNHSFDCWEPWYTNNDLDVLCKHCYEKLDYEAV